MSNYSTFIRFFLLLTASHKLLFNNVYNFFLMLIVTFYCNIAIYGVCQKRCLPKFAKNYLKMLLIFDKSIDLCQVCGIVF